VKSELEFGCKVARMFINANVIIALQFCSVWLVGFFKVMTYAILLISPGRWQQAKTQQPIGVVGLVIIHVNG